LNQSAFVLGGMVNTALVLMCGFRPGRRLGGSAIIASAICMLCPFVLLRRLDGDLGNSAAVWGNAGDWCDATLRMPLPVMGSADPQHIKPMLRLVTPVMCLEVLARGTPLRLATRWLRDQAGLSRGEQCTASPIRRRVSVAVPAKGFAV
jgi:hypothetical protein